MTKKNLPSRAAQGALLTVLTLSACALIALTAHADEHEGAYPTKAIAVLTPTQGNTAHGQVTFTKTDDGILIEARVEGLTPGKHGFHIHQFGDISSPDGKSAGGHFNPARMDHSGPHAEARHVGDLGNLEANAEGIAEYKRLDKTVQLHGAHVILGRGVVVHAGEDDLKSQPTGAAGGRVAVGVIGVAKSE